MRRVSSGSVADTSRASEWFARFLAGSAAAAAGELGVVGETVGNSPDGSVGEVRPVGSGGSPLDPSVLLGRLGSVVAGGVLAATTSMVAAEWTRPWRPAPWP